ncbi:MAG: phosphoadenylyl-sulfate reductase [Myxococcales bacterium]|nr:phosphoadenylyl-sulfate reductase [Myxococcales bacterium]
MARDVFSDGALAALNGALEARDAAGRLGWALARYGDRLLLTSAFGPGGGALLHLWATVNPGAPVYFLDTGFIFEETLRYRDAMVARLGLTLKVLTPTLEKGAFLSKYGLTVYQDNPDLCCEKNKVEPLDAALSGFDGWVSGLRRSQGGARGETPVLVATEGPTKVHPLVDWSPRDVYAYQKAHDLPEHPLFEQGYTSVGCVPCTRPPLEGEGERGGRWAGSGKTECGLHTFLKTRGA